MKSTQPIFPDLKLSDAPRIGIFGHYGNENLGDEAIIEAVVRQIHRRLPAASLIGFSINPRDTAERFEMPAYPIRRGLDRRRPSETQTRAAHKPNESGAGTTHQTGLKSRLKRIPVLRELIKLAGLSISALTRLTAEVKFLWKSKQRLRNIDLLMITGSNQFLDNFGGPWGFPYTLCKWAWLARLVGTPVVYVSVGAGPISASLSFRLIRWALIPARYVSMRDEPSLALLRDHGYRGRASVFPDLAFSLPSRSKDKASPAEGRQPVVGINPMPVYDKRYWCVHDDNLYERYVREMALFTKGLLDLSYPCFLWSTQPRDELVIVDILDHLENELAQVIDREAMTRMPRTVAELVLVLGDMDIAVPTRFHGVVLSLWNGIPTLSVCYHRKQRDLMEDMGQGEHAVTFETLDSRELLTRFSALAENLPAVRAQISKSNIAYEQALDEQYDGLLGTASQSYEISGSADKLFDSGSQHAS